MAGFQLTLHGRIWVTPEVRFASMIALLVDCYASLMVFADLYLPLQSRIQRPVTFVFGFR
jgi:hypothetical protein